jgi:hypothetical protein
MTHTVVVDALGVAVGVETPDAALAAGVRRAWSACLLPETSSPKASVAAPATVSTADALETITQQVTVAAVGERAGDLLMLHACALADEKTRRAVVLVGRSGVGKSTLSRTLGQHLTYLSDETAAVDDQGRVLAYPKPLSLLEVPGRPKEQTSPEILGLRSGSGWYDVAAVALLERNSSAGPLVTELSTVPAIALLAEHTSYLALLGRPLSRVAGVLHRAGGLRVVEYAESSTLRPLVDDWLA